MLTGHTTSSVWVDLDSFLQSPPRSAGGGDTGVSGAPLVEFGSPASRRSRDRAPVNDTTEWKQMSVWARALFETLMRSSVEKRSEAGYGGGARLTR